MVTKNELRIGSYIEHDGRPIQVTGHYLHDLEEDRVKPGNPIPITEEWLFNLGFTDDSDPYTKDGSNSYWAGRYNYVYMGKSPEARYFRLYANPERDWDNKDIRGHRMGKWMFYACQYWVRSIEYVHELQNTFFMLTGEDFPSITPSK